MTYVTENTEWPTAVEIKISVKELIDLYYSLADNPDATGERFATEVFSADGEIKASKSCRGTEGVYRLPFICSSVADLVLSEIKRYRDGAWDTVALRRHTIKRVYAHDADGTDLMILAVNTTGLKDGQSVTGDFTARIIVDQESLSREQPRLKYVQVWAVRTFEASCPILPHNRLIGIAP